MYKKRICPVCNGKIEAGYDLVEDKETWKVCAVYSAKCDKCGIQVSAEHTKMFELFPIIEAERVEDISEFRGYLEPSPYENYAKGSVGLSDKGMGSEFLYYTGMFPRVDGFSLDTDYKEFKFFNTCECGGEHKDKCNGV